MPNYAEILAFLANNPPRGESDRELHASLLELVAQCLRSNQLQMDDEDGEYLEPGDIQWITVN